MADTKELTIGVLILLLVSGGVYLIPKAISNDYAFYTCNDKIENETAGMLCWELSNVNSNKLQTRCYWNISAPTRYKRCDSGWKIYDGTIVGEETKPMEDYVDISVSVGDNQKEFYKSIDIEKVNASSCERMSKRECCFEFMGRQCIIVAYKNGTLFNKSKLIRNHEIKINETIHDLRQGLEAYKNNSLWNGTILPAKVITLI